MPLGAYIRALNMLEELPADFLAAAFPKMEYEEIMAKLKGFDMGTIEAFTRGIFVIFPSYMVRFTAAVSGIDEDTLLNNADIGLDGFIDILIAVVEVNQLGKLMRNLKTLSAIQNSMKV